MMKGSSYPPVARETENENFQVKFMGEADQSRDQNPRGRSGKEGRNEGGRKEGRKEERKKRRGPQILLLKHPAQMSPQRHWARQVLTEGPKLALQRPGRPCLFRGFT